MDDANSVYACLAALGTAGSGATTRALDLLVVAASLGVIDRAHIATLVGALGSLPVHRSLVFSSKGPLVQVSIDGSGIIRWFSSKGPSSGSRGRRAPGSEWWAGGGGRRDTVV